MKKEVKEQTVDEKELLRRRKTMRILKILLLVLDALALFLLILQITMKSVSYYSYAILIICNIITFMVKPDTGEIKKDIKKSKVK